MATGIIAEGHACPIMVKAEHVKKLLIAVAGSLIAGIILFLILPGDNGGTGPENSSISSFAADPSSITVGGTSTLSWSVSDATAVTIDQGIGSVGLISDCRVSPTTTTIYTLTASNEAGSSTATVQVTVSLIPLPVIDSFTTDPSSITEGGSSELSWSVSDATAVTIDQGIGSVGLSSDCSVSPTTTTTYTLTASNEAGSSTAAVQVTVSAPPLPPTDYMIATSLYHTVGRKPDGTVLATGLNYEQCDVDDWTDILHVFADDHQTVGLKSDGTVVVAGCWDWDDWDQCDVDDWTDITQVSASRYHTIGLRSDGTVVVAGCGESQSSSPCDVGDWVGITQVAAGKRHTVGIRDDGRVIAAGYNDERCDVSDWTDIIQIAAGGEYTVGLKSDGTVVATMWAGAWDHGQCDIGSWRDIIQVVAGDDHTVGLKSDGTVVAVGDNQRGQCDVDSWTDIIQVAAGDDHTVGLQSNGRVVAVGWCYYGQCDVDGWDLI